MFDLVISICVVAVLAVPVLLIFKTSRQKAAALMLYVFLLIWIARFLVGYFGDTDASELNLFESVWDSLLHAIETFTMNEDYSTYTASGKELFRRLGHPGISITYGALISVLNVCAPLLGGALVLDILLQFFPQLKLVLMSGRGKFVFSELSEETLLLAEDIQKNHYLACIEAADDRNTSVSKYSGKGLLLFTDTENADKSFVDRANKAGAVCLKRKMSDIPLRKSRYVDYFITGEDIVENARLFSGLLDGAGKERSLWPHGRNDEDFPVAIYYFTRNEQDAVLMKKIYQKKTGGEAAGGDQHVLVRFVDLSMQTAVNLMYDCPLFYPLMGIDNGPQRQKLCVTISGNDRDALEIFKAVFWCGQMSKITPCINLVSKNVQKFREEIAGECPQLLESCDPNSPILSIHPGMAEKDDQAEKNPPYAEVSFTEEMDDSLLRDTDYFIITSDDDAGAVSCEEEIRMRTESELSSKRQVIAVRIRNSDTAEVLKKTDPGTYETFVFPFGMTERVYSVRNVYMDEFTSDALQGDAMYNRRKQKAFLKDEYSYWANTARAVHAPYKAFMLGCLEDLDFNKTGTDRFVVKKERMDLTKDECDTAAFIEHRRWNAFMRTRGFSSFSGEQYHKWYDLTGTHKSLDLKLHNCLVESAESPVPLPEDLRMDDQIYDCLDKATYDACHVECLAENKEMTYEMLEERNYKRYDYPWVGGHLEAMLLKSGSDDDV